MGRFRVKAFVEAVQFHKDEQPWPEGVEKAKLQGDRRNWAGFWRIGDPIVRGVRGTCPVKEGDWVVKSPKGLFVMEDAEFQETYEQTN